METDLMIGDLVKIWVYPRDEKQDLLTARITGIITRVGEDDMNIMEGRILSTNGVFSRHLDDYEPITLTEDILLKNGFVFNAESDSLHYRAYHIKNCVVFWKTDTNNFSALILQSGVTFEYVHELQHALRLVGLNDLADNFKVK